MSVVHVVMPVDVDDPRRPSGGNHYDRRVCDELRRLGWSVREHRVAGDGLGGALSAIPDGACALVDGLLASGAAAAVLPHAERTQLTVLVHLPLGVEQHGARATERTVLAGCPAVVTTSAWTRTWLLAHYRLDPRRVHVVHPGVDRAAPVVTRPDGGRLLVVGRVTPAKGHDVLAAALAGLTDLSWTCRCVGSLESDPAFAAAFRRLVDRTSLGDRIELRGPLPARRVGRAYAAADLLLVPSRLETYGMVVTEALARGLPVVAAAAGGVPEALGRLPDGRLPGLLVPPGDVAALGAALRSWLTDADLRARLREAARARGAELAGWPAAAQRLGEVLLRPAGRREPDLNHPGVPVVSEVMSRARRRGAASR